MKLKDLLALTVLVALGVTASGVATANQVLPPLPLQQVAAGQKVFGCVLRPQPPKQHAGSPFSITGTGLVMCDKAHKYNRMIVDPQYNFPAGQVGPTAHWGNGGQVTLSTRPIAAHAGYKLVTHPFPCDQSAAMPGTYRTQLQLWIPKSTHPFQYRRLVAYSSSVYLSCM